MLADLHACLERYGYVKVPNLLSPEVRGIARLYMDISHRSARMVESDNQVTKGQFEEYGALLSETLLCRLSPTIEEFVKSPLIPSYSFWRLYERGAILREHVDRAACEIGVSVAIDVEPRRCAWPLWLRGRDDKAQAIDLKPGDAVVYFGTQVPHWRGSFGGDVQYQMFLHYVRRNGPNAKLAYDGRTACGLAPVSSLAPQQPHSQAHRKAKRG